MLYDSTLYWCTLSFDYRIMFWWRNLSSANIAGKYGMQDRYSNMKQSRRKTSKTTVASGNLNFQTKECLNFVKLLILDQKLWQRNFWNNIFWINKSSTTHHNITLILWSPKTDNALFSQHKQTMNATSTALSFNLQITLRSIVWTLTGLTGHWRSFLRATACIL